MPRKMINIAFTNFPQMNPEQISQLQSVSPRLHLTDVSEMLKADGQGDPSIRRKMDQILADVEIYFGLPLPVNIISRAPKLKWIQSPIAGVDQFLTPEVVTSPVILTKAKIHEEQISETVFCFMLMLARHSLELFKAQQQKKWATVEPVILHKKTLGILGLGNIGLEVARLAKSFKMRVLAMKAHPEGRYENVDTIYSPDGLNEILKQSDFLAVILPITPGTKGLIGEKELRLMKPTSFIINVARGGIVDEKALVTALEQNWIAGAAFDVFVSDPKPLPADSKLWELPNLIITPHNAGLRPDYTKLVIDQFCINLRRYIRGKEMIGVVDKKMGY